MKLTFFLLTVTFLQVSAKGVAQTMTLSGKDIPLEKIFKEIKKQTGYVVFCNYNLLKNAKPVSLRVKNEELQNVLDEVLKNQALTYSIENKTIFIAKQPDVLKPPLLLNIEATSLDVSGRAINEDGKPVEGLSVMVKNTKKGTVTRSDGSFLLKNVEEDAILVFSGTNIMTKEIEVNGRSSVGTITLNLKLTSSEEIVIDVNTGYQKISKTRMVGSAVTISAKEIEASSYNSVAEILLGRVPGMQINTPGGAPGTFSNIRIRGTNSINGNKEPLWIVDGLPMSGGVQNIRGSTVSSIGSSIMDNGIGNIHPQDIESITVLKDASASAIYGAQAANGVIVITTKKGVEKEPVISYAGRFGVTSAPNINNLNMMNSNQKVDFELQLMEDWNDGWNAGRAGRLYFLNDLGQISRQDYEAQIQALRNINTDWFKEIFRTGIEQSHSFSIRGGGKSSTYYASLNHRKEDGVLMNNTNNNTGVNLNFNFQGVKNLRIGIGLNGNLQNNKSTYSSVDPFKYAVFANPYEVPYNADGSYAGDATYLATNTSTNTVAKQTVLEGFNILRELNENTQKSIGSDILSNLRIEYDIMPELTAEIRAGYAYSSVYSEKVKGAGTYSNYSGNWATSAYSGNLPLWYNETYGSLGESNSYQKKWTARGTLTYKKSIANTHYLTLFLGSEWQSTETNVNNQLFPQFAENYRIGLVPSFPDNPNLSYQDMTSKINGLHSTGVAQTRYVGFFGNLAYSFQDRYVFSFNMRSDGADIIGDGEKFSPLWSAGVRWNPLKESFIKNQSLFSQLALRGSYGFTGNIDRNAYPFGVITLGNIIYNNAIVATQFSYPNPYITWEKKRDVSLGLDFGFLDDLITGTVEYYNNETKDLLGQRSTPMSYGRDSYSANVSSIANKGFDIGLNLNLRFSDKVIWQNGFNIARNENELTETLYKNIGEALNYRGGSFNVQGKKYGDIYGQQYAGVDPATGQALIWLNNSGKEKFAETYGIDVSEAPDKMRMNLSGANDIFLANLKPIANTVPEISGGFSSYLRVLNFDFRVFFTYSLGYDVPRFNDILGTPSNASGSNQLPAGRLNRSVELLDRWRTKGDHSNIPIQNSGASYYASGSLDTRYGNGDYLNMRDVSFGYNIDNNIVTKLGFERAKVSVQMTNLFTLTKYSGIDVLTRGSYGYPLPRTVKLNLSVSF